MSVARPHVKGIAVIYLLAALWAPLWASPAAAGGSKPFRAAPVKDAASLRLLPARAWPPPESDQEQMLLKLSYLRGILDALQYAEVAPKTAGRLLKDIQGMDLSEIAAAIDRYYLADPRRRDLPPAAVLFRVLPGARGKPEPSLITR